MLELLSIRLISEALLEANFEYSTWEGHNEYDLNDKGRKNYKEVKQMECRISLGARCAS